MAREWLRGLFRPLHYAIPDEIPVVGEATMVATGVYLGGDYLYHHWPWFHDTCNTVGHAVGSAASTAGHAAGSAAKAIELARPGRQRGARK